MWELDYKESWALKNWCFWTVALEKILDSPLDCLEIQAVKTQGNQKNTTTTNLGTEKMPLSDAAWSRKANTAVERAWSLAWNSLPSGAKTLSNWGKGLKNCHPEDNCEESLWLGQGHRFKNLRRWWEADDYPGPRLAGSSRVTEKVPLPRSGQSGCLRLWMKNNKEYSISSTTGFEG